jgi:hypothetical protein
MAEQSPRNSPEIHRELHHVRRQGDIDAKPLLNIPSDIERSRHSWRRQPQCVR